MVRIQTQSTLTAALTHGCYNATLFATCELGSPCNSTIEHVSKTVKLRPKPSSQGRVAPNSPCRCISLPIIGLSGTIDCVTTYFDFILAALLSLLDQLALALPSTLAVYVHNLVPSPPTLLGLMAKSEISKER